jgi:hypothetical protein
MRVHKTQTTNLPEVLFDHTHRIEHSSTPNTAGERKIAAAQGSHQREAAQSDCCTALPETAGCNVRDLVGVIRNDGGGKRKHSDDKPLRTRPEASTKTQ